MPVQEHPDGNASTEGAEVSVDDPSELENSGSPAEGSPAYHQLNLLSEPEYTIIKQKIRFQHTVMQTKRTERTALPGIVSLQDPAEAVSGSKKNHMIYYPILPNG